MLKKLEELSNFIGNTPTRHLVFKNAHIYAKLEYNNFSGSSKDRAAMSIIYNGIKEERVNRNSTIVASSSGNLAIALASICKILKLKFIPVIDPNINKDCETLLNLLSYRVIKVNERDKTGGYLLTRISTVEEVCKNTEDSFCADQYGDPNNYRGYYGLGDEIIRAFDELDYIFIAVSSSGAITGISRSVKKINPEVKIIGVDVEGSVIFGQPPMRRYISGIGASKVPPIMHNAIIDDVIIVSQADIIKGCFQLLNEQAIFAGASSGAVYMASKAYFRESREVRKPVALLIFPDKGYAYLDTIFNKEWGIEMINKAKKPEVLEDIKP